MKQNDIADLKRLPLENLENIFNVYKDEKGMYFYNLLQTISLPQNLPESLFSVYTIKYGDTWPFISYKTLNSPNVWWIILMVNNIENPTKMPENGSSIKIPKPEFVRQVISEIRKNQ